METSWCAHRIANTKSRDDASIARPPPYASTPSGRAGRESGRSAFPCLDRSSVPQRLARLQRVLNPLERLTLAEQAHERFTLQIEQVLLADRRRMRHVVAAAENVREL